MSNCTASEWLDLLHCSDDYLQEKEFTGEAAQAWQALQDISVQNLLTLSTGEQEQLFILAIQQKDLFLFQRLVQTIVPSALVAAYAAEDLRYLDLVLPHIPDLNALLFRVYSAPEVLNLLRRGAEVNTQDEEGNTTLLQGVRDQNVEVICVLLACGADNVANATGLTPLALAQENGEEVKWLLQRKFAKN